jgi:hypothetical protein
VRLGGGLVAALVGPGEDAVGVGGDLEDVQGFAAVVASAFGGEFGVGRGAALVGVGLAPGARLVDTSLIRLLCLVGNNSRLPSDDAYGCLLGTSSVCCELDLLVWRRLRSRPDSTWRSE